MSNFKIAMFCCSVIASFSCQSTHSADLKTQIKNLSPNSYWPLQNTFASETPSAQPITFVAQEEGGASANLYAAGFYTPDYFPVTPRHLSPVPESNGLWLGETTGDLAGVKRYLSLTAAIGGQQPTTAFNMDYKDEWTLHLLVSPDPDLNGQRPAEVVYYGGAAGANVQLIVDANSTGTLIKLRREGQGNINGPQITVNEAAPGARHWYHIIVRYGLNSGGDVTEVTLDVNSQSTAGLSNQSLFPQSSSPIILGRGSSQGYFNGAIQHFALWKRKLSNAEVATLKASLTIAPAATAPLAVDTNQMPRYFMWTVPTRENSLSGRDALNWQDPLWQIEGVYPIVRHKIDFPTASDQNPPGTPVQVGMGASDTAKQSYAWIKYIDSKLQQYSGKSLNDGIGYALSWQTWGNPAYTDSYYYSDRGAARGLMQNWRDAPSVWRNSVHATTAVPQELTEISTPFYREGMSQNAFRSVAIFKQLKSLLDADPTLSKPSRLHFDIESNANLNKIGEYFDAGFSGCVDKNSQLGWLCGSLLDSRAASFDTWGVNSYWGRNNNSLHTCLTTASTLDTNGEASSVYWGVNARTLANLLQAYDPKKGVWQAPNTCFQEEFSRFTNANYQYAINESLKKPAAQMLNSDIRISEFAHTAAGTNLASAIYSTARDAALLGNGKPENLDFSSPILYPPGKDAIDTDLSLKNWETRLSLSYSLFASQISNPADATAADVREAIDNLYVETQKHNLDIAVKAASPCAPIVQSPWFPYPGHQSSTNLPYSNMHEYTVKWQEVARLAVFAYRRGVREYLMWGDDVLLSGANATANLQGLEKIYAAVNHAKVNNFDFTTTGATNRSQDNFGVPDGVIDSSDYDYYVARYNEKDPEADIVGQNGQCALPDGLVTSHDLAAFSAHMSSQYFAYREGVDGGNLTSIAQLNSFIHARTPDATFIATNLAYGSDNAFYNDLGYGTNLQTFLGGDAASLSADPGDSSDAIVRMYGTVSLAAGTYNFKVRGDDGYQIKVDGQVVAAVDFAQAPTTLVHLPFTLSKGGIHIVEILYWDQGLQAVFKARISADGGTTYNVLQVN